MGSDAIYTPDDENKKRQRYKNIMTYEGCSDNPSSLQKTIHACKRLDVKEAILHKEIKKLKKEIKLFYKQHKKEVKY